MRSLHLSSFPQQGTTALAAQAKPMPLRKPKITLYNASWCWYCQRVRDKLDELGLAYEAIEVPIRHSERTEVMRISGQPSVPVLVDGDTVLDDDDVIIPYLERTYGSGNTSGERQAQ